MKVKRTDNVTLIIAVEVPRPMPVDSASVSFPQNNTFNGCYRERYIAPARETEEHAALCASGTQ